MVALPLPKTAAETALERAQRRWTRPDPADADGKAPQPRPRQIPGARLDAKGRVTIPKEMREALGIAPGAELLLQVVEGELRVVTPRVALGRLRAARDALLRRLGAAGA